ncbi:MAG: hypothetical protein J2P57_16595 [Acidimicrobiaceae bacterium]|nr:hypothetical protein [Acidimicrobiaceae bacterium]
MSLAPSSARARTSARLAVAAAVIVGTGALVLVLVAREGRKPPLSAHERTVRIYGADGSFGRAARLSHVASGQSFGVVGVPGWGFAPGEAAYFTAVGPDGTVFMANEPQDDNQVFPTAREMVVSEFSPASGRFANLVIPTSTGQTDVAGPWPSSTLRVGGADIADLQPIDVDGTERIGFLSAQPYEGWNISQNGVYPTLGYLTDGPRGWSYDAAEGVSALSIARSATAQTGQPCNQERSADGQPFADCRLPTEMDQLPHSHDLVITQYASNVPGGISGQITVLDTAGRLLASYAYPTITLPDGQTVDVHPREIDADPASPANDEHFVVIFDSSTGSQSGPFAMQEFTYDAATATITPLSAPVLTGDTAPDGTALGFETAQYDRHGDLWAAQSQTGTLTGGPIAIYRPTPAGATLARAGCTVAPTWNGTPWASRCPPDTHITQTTTLGIVRSINQDPTTGAMLIATMSGDLLPIQTANNETTLTPEPPIDLALNALTDRTNALTDRTTTLTGIRKGAIDPTTHTLYLPIQQIERAGACGARACAPRRLDQWLVAVNLDQVVGGQRRGTHRRPS